MPLALLASILISLLAAASDAGAEEITGSVTPTEEGAAKTVTFSAPGDSAVLSVPVVAGESVSMISTEAAVSGTYRLEWLSPESESVRAWSPPGEADGFFEAVRFEEAGEATLLIDPEGSATGSITFTLYDASDRTSTVSLAGGGETKTLTIGAPGQRRLVHFEGSEGQRISLVPSGAGFEGEFHVETPASEALEGSGGTLEGTRGPLALPETGTYALVLTADGAQTGSVSLDFEDSSLAVAYGFDEGEGDETRDESGLGHTGEIEGATWSEPARQPGHSLVFDGEEGCLTVHESSGIDLQHGFTVDAWVRPETSWETEEREETTIFEVPAGETSPAVALVVGRTNEGILEAVVGEETVGEFAVAADPEEVGWGLWRYVAMTFDGTDLKLYVGGELVGQTSVETPAAGAGAMTVGCSRTAPSTFRGGIDEFRVYTRALSGGEIANDESTQVQPVHLDVYGQLASVGEGQFVGMNGGLYVRAGAKGEAEIEGLQLKVDGEPVKTMSRAEALEDGGFEYCSEGTCYLGYEYRSIFPPGISSGEHTVSIVATGDHGKEATYEKTVEVDAGPPVIHLSGRLYEDGGVVTEEPEELVVSATDEGTGDSGIEYVTFRVDGEWEGAEWSACEGGCAGRLEASYAYSSKEWGTGPHELSVTAVDAAGNATTETLTVQSSLESVELEVAGQLAEAPEGGIIGIEEGLSVRAGAIGEAEVEGFELKVDGKSVAVTTRKEVLEGGGSESCSGKRCYLSYEYKSPFPPGLASGEHTVAVAALSHHGMETLYEKKVKVDADPPVIHLSGKLYEEGGQLTEESEKLAVSANDGEGADASGVKSVSIYVDGEREEGNTSACEGGCGGALETSYAYSQKEWGGNPRKLTVIAVDAAGNKTMDSLMVEQPAPAVEPECGSAECTDVWTGPAEGSWGTAKYWSAERVPTSSDTVYIGAGKSVNVSGTSAAAASVHVKGALSVTHAGWLRLGNPPSGSTIDHLDIALGELSAEGDVTVADSLDLLNFGQLKNSGTTRLSSGGTGVVGGADLEGGTFINEGMLTFEDENRAFRLLEGAKFENEGTAESEEFSSISLSEGSEIQNDGVYVGGPVTWIKPEIETPSSTTAFVNEGTFKSAGTPVLSTIIEVPFENTGAVEAGTGIVEFKGTTAISFDGSLSSEGEGLIRSDDGVLEIEGGNISGKLSQWWGRERIEGGVSASNLTLWGGGGPEWGNAVIELDQPNLPVRSLLLDEYATLTGPADVTVSEELWWTSSVDLAGTGKVVVEPMATGLIQGPAELEQTFVNEGTINFTYGKLLLKGTAVFENVGTFNANSESKSGGVAYEGTGSGEFVNTGTFEKTSGAGTTVVEAPFRNEGAIKESSGHLEIEHPIMLRSSEHAPEEACGKAGDPVACATGNFTEAQTDLEIGGRGVGLDLTRTYSAQAAAAGSLGIFGYGWTSSFADHLTSEEGGAMETLTEASGGTVPFARSGAAWIAPSWSQDMLTGSTEAGFTLSLPGRAQEKFSGTGHLESVTDRNGNATTLAYNALGELETITDSSGRTITFTYNAEGLVEKAEDPMSHVVEYTYESKQLKSVTLPGESVPSWQFEYDGSHRMTSITDGRGGKTTNEYDGSDRVISQTDPAGRTLTWGYDGFHTTIANEATGAVTDEWFDSDNQPTSITRGFDTASATTETFGYTATGLLASRTDGDGHTTTYGYDSAGDRTSERNAEGDETRWTYNEAHQVLTETQPNGEKTTITRNANGSPETISRPAPESKTQAVSYEYGPHGELESMTDPLGRAWTFGYDKYGDRISATDPEGDKRIWAYDEDSQVTSKVSPRGNEEGAEAAKFTTEIERDAQGRPIKVTDPLGGTTKTAYDADGNVESITNPDGHKTTFTYDADNELTKVERPNGAVEETGYDGAGQVISEIDGNNQKTTYVRNILEQPVETIDPLERKTTRTFDSAGNLNTLKDPEGRTTTYGYDKANRLKEVSYSAEPGLNTTLGYDENGDPTSMKDATGESTWEYDQLGRLVHSKNGHGETVVWEYNLADEPVGLTYPNGKSISRSYDKAGRLESVTDWLGHTTSFSYNRDSRPTTTTFPIATTDADEYGYDRADRMVSVTMKKGAETLASLAYSRDPAGQLESLISKGLPGDETESFSYDENERLTKAGSAEFGYDAANNITKAPGTTNAFDKASEIETATGATLGFDKEGERTKDTPSSGPATTYKYDQAGNLTAIERPEEGETPAIGESFGYDGAGLLASRTVGLITTHFVWDLSESPEPLLSDGADSYVYGPGGMPFEQISSEEVPTYLHHDQLGSTRLLTNASGEAAATFTYGSYGGLTGHTRTATTALGYAGQYTLGQSDLQYLRARLYDPATAQFLTRDPAVAATREPYGYAGDDPIGMVDPTGESFIEDLAGIADGSCAVTAEIPGVDAATCGAAAAATAAAATVALAEAVSSGGEEEGEGEGAAVEEVGCEGATINGWTKHGREQSLERDEGRGFSDAAAEDAAENPEQVIPRPNGTKLYIGKDGAVVLNDDDEVVTGWARNRNGWRYK